MLIVVMVACVGLFSIPVFGQTDVEIPPWVKGVANFWVEDKIDDGEFAEALEFLIDSDIIELDSNIIELDSNIIQSDSIVIVPETKVDKNPFGMEEDNRTLGKKHAESIALLDKQMKDQKEMYEEKIINLNDINDKQYAEFKEFQYEYSEENTKLKEKIRDLEKEISQLENDAGK